MTFKVFLGFFFVLAPATTLCIFDHVVFSQFFLECRVIKFIFTIFHRQYYIITKTLVTAFKDQPCFLGTFLYKLTCIYVFENPKQNVVFWVFETLKSISQFRANESSPCVLTIFFFEAGHNVWVWTKQKLTFFAFYSNFLQFFFAIDYKN